MPVWGALIVSTCFMVFISGLASLIGGAVIVEGAGHRLEHYGTVGLIGAGCILASLALAGRLRAAA